MKAFIGDYVKTRRHSLIGRVITKYSSFQEVPTGIHWFRAQEPALPESSLDEPWYEILVQEGGSAYIAEWDIEEILPTVLDLGNIWEAFYFKK